MTDPPRRPARRREDALARRARRAEVTDPEILMEAAGAFLAVRPRSVMETRRRLRHLGYPEALCDQVVERLIELGYLDDRAFAQAWLESRDRARPRGRWALAQELQRKGVPRDVVEDALEERERSGPAGGEDAAIAGPGTAAELAGASGPAAAAGIRAVFTEPDGGAVELDAALRLVQRRAASLAREADPRRRRQKAYALLARHGFAPDICRQAARTVLDEPADPGDDGV